ncbi:AI-2E family transporter, partial [Acetobacteraceae bacterium]|nr:AI-2E family transporter [Candidatus Parcubacteria bacterium]
MNPESLQGRFLLVLVVLCLILGGFVISPFWVPLFLAIVFAVALHPLYMRFSRSLGNYRSIAALLTILVAIVGVLIPLAILLTLLSREAIGVYAAFHEGSAGAYLQEMLQSAQNLLNRYVPNAPDLLGTFAQNINSYAKTALGSLAGYLATAASVTA